MTESGEGFLNLVRVVEAPPQAEGEIKILTLELYEDGFIVRHVLPGGFEMPASAEEATINPIGLMSLTLRDDLGTDYKLVAANSGRTHGLTMFRPPVPAEAQWLDVLTKAGFVRFDLAAESGLQP
jgi:hypothetical protein